MKKLRPYIALDIESTGSNTEKSNVLQVAWIVDDGESPIENLRSRSYFIENQTISYAEPYALGMNAWIFQELMKQSADRKYPTANLAEVLTILAKDVEYCGQLALGFDSHVGEKKASTRVQLAGKNVGSFDWPMLKNQLKAFDPANSAQAVDAEIASIGLGSAHVDHRFIDAGAIFFEMFGKNPGFASINKLIGQPDITHDALDDARAVVIAVRWRMGIP